jgi:hypothetical protein
MSASDDGGWFSLVLSDPSAFRALAETSRNDPSISAAKRVSLGIRQQIEEMIAVHEPADRGGPEIGELIEMALREAGDAPSEADV